MFSSMPKNFNQSITKTGIGQREVYTRLGWGGVGVGVVTHVKDTNVAVLRGHHCM